MLPFLNDYHYTKKLRYMIPSWNIDDQSILQIDSTTGHRKPKVVVSDVAFPWLLDPCKKNKISIDSFQSILGHNWKNPIFPKLVVSAESWKH